MKKSLLALAVLGAFAGAASAQSSVTLYGRVDLSIGKNVGSTPKFMANGSGSRLGVRGTEDLGGGLSAFFNIEHRYNADTGSMSDTNRMWGGRSLVGLQGSFGKVTFGREYTTAFLMSQVAADPWGWDTVATAITIPVTRGGAIGQVRTDSSITYNVAASGFSFGVQIGEATDQYNNTPDKPFNFGLGYSAGPLSLGLGYENPGNANDKWTTFNAAYNMGGFTLGGVIGNGKNAANASTKSWGLSAVAPMGAGEFRAMFGQLKVGGTKTHSGFSLGYHHSLSKRTTLYADLSNNSKAATSKTGYDVGIKHNF